MVLSSATTESKCAHYLFVRFFSSYFTQDSTTWGESTCGNLQLWGSSQFGIRALDGVGNIIDTAGDYTVKSATCLDPISTDATGHWAAKFLPSSNDVFLKSTRPLVYTGPGACKKYQVVLKAVAGNANGECTAIIDVKNANDPPAWNPNMVFDLATPEKSIAGAPVTMGCDAYLSNFAECDLLGTVAPNANFDLVTDPDAGQDVLFEIVKPTSNGGEYPSFNYGGTTALRSDEIFGVSGCT